MKLLSHGLCRISVFVLIFTMLAACNMGSSQPLTDTASEPTPTEEADKPTFKIMHVMSYHTPWEWTDTQFQGFQDALSGVDIEYKVFEMDTKNYSTEEQKQMKAEEARALIDDWQPDLLFTSDDDAQKYVARHYAGTSMPIVFSAVGSPPEELFGNSRNYTGVMEYEHFVESVNLLREIQPDIREIAVVLDGDSMWAPVRERMELQIPGLEGLSFPIWDEITSFEVYKQKMLEYQDQVDAVALIGIFTFEDEDGQNVHYRDVLKWTAENSRLPDFSFWKDRVSYGTLAVVSVSGYEQGFEAGLLAKQILVDGKSPHTLPIQASMKGEPLINLARANELGIQIRSQTLLSSKVVTDYEWELSE